MTARTIWILGLALGAFLPGTNIATARDKPQSPVGRFECRDWESEITILQAVLVLRADGTYEATDKVDDLNAHRPTAGRYTFNEDKQQIDWTSGGWKDRFGTYMPHVKGTGFVVVHTKRDPENKADATLALCSRSISPVASPNWKAPGTWAVTEGTRFNACEWKKACDTEVRRDACH